MNESFQLERSAYVKGIREPMDALRFISNRMLEHRPRTDLTLRAYFLQERMALTPISQMAELDLDAVYPQGQTGDIAYIQTCAMADRDCEAAQMCIRDSPPSLHRLFQPELALSVGHANCSHALRRQAKFWLARTCF